MMKFKIQITIGIILACLFSANNLYGQSNLMEIAEQAKQRAKVLKQQEPERYRKVIDSRDLEAYKQYIRDYPRSENTVEIKKRIAEIELWQSAESNNTIDDYNDYLSKTQYHWFDDQAKDAIYRIMRKIEEAEWLQVSRIGTIEAFEKYIQDNPNSSYREDAERAINRMEGEKAWMLIKNSSDRAKIQDFVDKYPNATKELAAARLILCQLKGKEYYEQGDLRMAYNEFSSILDRNAITPENRDAYEATMEWHAFMQLNAESSKADINYFITKYPNSKYMTQVNNLLAIAQAKELSLTSSEYDYNKIRELVTDPNTRKIVESHIASNAQKRQEYQKKLRRSLRDMNGGLFNMGVEFLDMGWSGAASDLGLSVYYYDIGAMIRLGNYASPVQFACGVKFGLMRNTGTIETNSGYGYDYDYGYDDYTSTSYDESLFHMPTYAQLKVNLFKVSQASRFFISGQYQYNIVYDDRLENDMAWGAGCGFAWKNIDWLFYYRQDIGHNDFIGSNQYFIGTSLTYYFKL